MDFLIRFTSQTCDYNSTIYQLDGHPLDWQAQILTIASFPKLLYEHGMVDIPYLQGTVNVWAPRFRLNARAAVASLHSWLEFLQAISDKFTKSVTNLSHQIVTVASFDISQASVSKTSGFTSYFVARASGNFYQTQASYKCWREQCKLISPVANPVESWCL